MRKYVVGIVLIMWFVMSSLTMAPRYEEQIEEQKEATAKITVTQYEFEPNTEMYNSDGTPNSYRMKKDARYIAKVIYGCAKDNSVEAKEAVAWVILNRVASQWYPDTVEEVVEQKYQWLNYQFSNPIEDNIQIAYKAVVDYYNGNRKYDSDYLYMECTNYKIILRNSFEETKNTKFLEVR